ncbi:sugar phosphate isomerase/epimerase [Leucobacter sp. wl10]|uniref:sugar phosphate isomerase/epimerase family protein n=1 Tax=Leucobacter sp. wl10 TaxID=2304677 RepID=UPI000E5BB00A|nr:sugar phosphate isomerase/epimerase family protein [Leucobacter sp. wl10]RGE22036.1 sugar phosphate isomerase/epimerase [Leucobacter sp. wl10]
MKLCLNQATAMPYGLEETIRASAAAGIEHIGVWVEPVQEAGPAAVRRWLNDSGLTATSMSRVGFLTNKRGVELSAAYDAVRSALEMCAELSIPTLSFVAGGLPEHDRSIRNAEGRVRDAFETLLPDIVSSGVQVMLEPIHPLFVNDRSIITTVGQALRVIDGLPAEQVGVLVDSWATFWDPEFEDSVARAGSQGRLSGYQINDFKLPLPAPNNMQSRLQPGDGVIDLVAMTRTMLEAGYTGPIEVEIFNDDIWAQPLDVILRQTVEAYDRVIVQNLVR